MRKVAIDLNVVLESLDHLDIENQTYVSEILKKRLINLRREGIARRGREAERNYKRGKIHQGNASDFLKDLND